MKKCTLVRWFVPMLFLLAVTPAFAAGSNDVISREELEATPVASVADILSKLPKQEAGIQVFYQDADALTPGGMGSAVYNWSGSVIGAGVDYTFRPNVNSGLYYRGMGGYGIGNEKLEVGGVAGYTDKVTLKAIYGSLDIGCLAPITTKTAAYGQIGAFYSTTKGTFDDGVSEVDGEPFKVFGLDTAVGLRYSVGARNSAFIEQYSQFGWGSGEQDGSKYNASVKYGCFRGGMRFGF